MVAIYDENLIKIPIIIVLSIKQIQIIIVEALLDSNLKKKVLYTSFVPLKRRIFEIIYALSFESAFY
jgi:hypothetical protein